MIKQLLFLFLPTNSLWLMRFFFVSGILCFYIFFCICLAVFLWYLSLFLFEKIYIDLSVCLFVIDLIWIQESKCFYLLTIFLLSSYCMFYIAFRCLAIPTWEDPRYHRLPIITAASSITYIVWFILVIWNIFPSLKSNKYDACES